MIILVPIYLQTTFNVVFISPINSRRLFSLKKLEQFTIIAFPELCKKEGS